MPQKNTDSRSDQKGRPSKQRKVSQKHVSIEHKRPKLNKYDSDSGSMPGGKSTKSSGESSSSSRKKLPKPRHNQRKRAAEKKQEAVLKIIPLGGLDAIGKNMTVFECGNDIILDDAGLMFPDDDHPGVDLILPDYTYVLENADKLRGIVITHGHEDHTGSLPYLLKDLDREVCIYATKLTLGLIEGKFKEHRVKNAKLCEIKPGETIKLGCMTAEFFSVNHSIPDAVGVFFRSPAGNVLHTGDFKLDQSPIDGVHTDFGALARFGKEGVDLMLSDSTNATNPNFTPSEAEVGKTLDALISQAKGGVVVASFASHIHRMQQICDAAVRNGRKVAVTGRSMVQNTDIARRLGYLHISDSDLLDAYDVKGMPSDQYVVMCTGSQGEPLSALARMANGEHKTITIEEDDTVIISATPVPGNEKAVTRVINSLAKIGADVYDKSRARVHVSGHASAEELKLVLSIVEPMAFMPVHGESTHLRAHARLAEATGVDHDQIFICENGDTIELSSKGVNKGPVVPNGIVLVDGLSVGDTSETVLRERTSLGEAGIAIVTCAIDSKSQKMLGDVVIDMRGIAGGDDYELSDAVRSSVRNSITRGLDKEENVKQLKKNARSSVLSVLWERANQRPMVVVNLLEV